jgi:hypothetical protein
MGIMYVSEVLSQLCSYKNNVRGEEEIISQLISS